jgi:uridine phosphorylase
MRFDERARVAQNREFLTFSGSLCGEKVNVTSTGIGGPSAAIAVEELASLGADTFIRVGTTGGMQPQVRAGDLVVAAAAVREEGTSRQFLPLSFPAVADVEVTDALREAARRGKARHHVGVVHSKDSFYAQEVEMYKHPRGHMKLERWEEMTAGGVLASEMECAAVFVLSKVLGRRAGAVLLVGGTLPDMRMLAGMTPEERLELYEAFQVSGGLPPLDDVIETAIEALRILISQDKARAKTSN